MPEGIELDLDTLRLDGTPERRGNGSFTVTATNSAGTADTTVSWTVSCQHSDAEIKAWLRGSQWNTVAILTSLEGGVRTLPDGSWEFYWRRFNSIFESFVFLDNGNIRIEREEAAGFDLYPATRIYTSEFPFVRAENCQGIEGSWEWSSEGSRQQARFRWVADAEDLSRSPRFRMIEGRWGPPYGFADFYWEVPDWGTYPLSPDR